MDTVYIYVVHSHDPELEEHVYEEFDDPYDAMKKAAKEVELETYVTEERGYAGEARMVSRVLDNPPKIIWDSDDYSGWQNYRYSDEYDKEFNSSDLDEDLDDSENNEELDDEADDEADDEVADYDKLTLNDEPGEKRNKKGKLILTEGGFSDTVTILSALLEDEWEAIKGYTDAASQLEKLDDADVPNKEIILDTLSHISKEEATHVGQLERLLHEIDPEYDISQDEGEDETEEDLVDEEPEEIEDEDEEVKESIDYRAIQEEMEENEDQVECQVCYNLVDKDDAVKTDGGYYVCKDCMQKNHDEPELDEDFRGFGKADVGDEIKIVHLAGEDNRYDGKVGTVQYVDDIGQLHGTWGGLAIIPGEDDYTVIKRFNKDYDNEPDYYNL